MKHVIVPAQITTVEDKITGRLSLHQLLLLITPVLIDAAIYLVLPKNLKLNLYKLILMLLITAVFCLSALKFRGKILLLWGILIVKYNLRPGHYIFNKNEDHLRQEYRNLEINNAEEFMKLPELIPDWLRSVSDDDRLLMNKFKSNPELNLSFIPHKKAGLRVLVTQVK